MSDEPATVDAPIMLRVDITRAELKALKRLAVDEDKTVQSLVGEILRSRLVAV